MSGEIELVAILHPAAGKADRILELMGGVAKIVHEKEPGTLKYNLLKQTGDNPKIVVVEKYKDEAALKAHGKFPEFRESNKTMKKENLLTGPTQIYILKSAGGFASRL